MLTNYSYTEYLPSVYADSTNTILAKLNKATLYSLKVLSVHGVTMIKNNPEHVYGIKREFDETEEEMLGGECSRMVNSLISHSDAVVKVVLPKTYDQTIVDRIDGDYLELSARLYELVGSIDIRIEPVLLNENSDKSGFIESIMKYGQEIH
jgi:hypothetical protein